jgi:hypothetical protein
VRFDRDPVSDGDTVTGSLRVRVLATPGHTFTHLAYVLEHGGEVVAVFTGGSLLYGSTGRPDLLGPDHTTALARAQYASARRLARELPDTATILPTHGFGSFCAATQAQADSSTLAREKAVNPALRLGEQEYRRTLLAGLDAWPAYYAHMGPANTAGPAAPNLSPPRRADPDQLRRRIEAGEGVVDLRDRTAFAAGFLPGSLSFSVDSSFATYLGWALPWGTPVTLLGATEDQVATAQRELVRIGIDRPAAVAATPSRPTHRRQGRRPRRTAAGTSRSRPEHRQRVRRPVHLRQRAHVPGLAPYRARARGRRPGDRQTPAALSGRAVRPTPARAAADPARWRAVGGQLPRMDAPQRPMRRGEPLGTSALPRILAIAITILALVAAFLSLLAPGSGS